MSARFLSIVRSPSREYNCNDRELPGAMDARSLDIHSRAMLNAKAFRNAEIDIIESLREVEDDRTYRHFKQTSIYEYAMKTMKLSENVALTLIAIMRKSRRVPELTEAIRSGRVTTSKAKKIISVINEENKSAWLELAATKTSKQIEKAVVSQNPLASTKESLRYKTADRLELTLGVSEEWGELLRRVKDVASQKSKTAVSSEEALLLAMTAYLEKHDPLEKARRAQAKDSQQDNSQLESSQRESSELRNSQTTELLKNSPFSRTVPHRKPISAKVKHAVMLRDQRRCTEHDLDGNRCANERWLDVHHIVPVSAGGADHPDNLTTLCSEHHRLKHQEKEQIAVR